MDADDAEAAYIRKRADTSRCMARVATTDCARLAHESLANCYEQRLIALRRRPPFA